MPRGLHALNEGLAFLFEIAALVAISWWGCHIGDNTADHILLGLGAPLLAIVLWGLFAAPRSAVRTPMAGVLSVKIVVFGAAAVGLWFTGLHVLAVVFAVLVAINTTIATVDRNAAVRVSRRDS
ncbi:MAG TPA: YrdB family protein [Pseudonocardiaceae bacterium]